MNQKSLSITILIALTVCPSYSSAKGEGEDLLSRCKAFLIYKEDNRQPYNRMGAGLLRWNGKGRDGHDSSDCQNNARQ